MQYEAEPTPGGQETIPDVKQAQERLSLLEGPEARVSLASDAWERDGKNVLHTIYDNWAVNAIAKNPLARTWLDQEKDAAFGIYDFFAERVEIGGPTAATALAWASALGASLGLSGKDLALQAVSGGTGIPFVVLNEAFDVAYAYLEYGTADAIRVATQESKWLTGQFLAEALRALGVPAPVIAALKQAM
jgi:hypothetical protein